MQYIQSFTMRSAIVAIAGVVVAFSAIAYADEVVIVTGDTAAGENQPGWLFNRDVSTATPFEFNTGAASIGNGSIYILPIGANASDKFIAEYFRNTPIADLESFSYDFKIGPNSAETMEEHFYLSVYANFGESDDNKFYDCRYSIVPTTGSKANFTKVTFDPTQSYPVTTRTGSSASPYACPSVPADMDNLSNGSNIRAFAINVGDTSVNDVGLDGYIDNAVVTVSGETTVFDFEPYVVVTDKAQCKKGGWKEVTDAEGNPFKNQGQCVAYVMTKKPGKATLAKTIINDVKAVLASFGLPPAPGFPGGLLH